MKILLNSAAILALAIAPVAAQESISARAVAQANGVRIVWDEPQPQPYYYLVYRSPSGADFPKRVEPNFYSTRASWIDPGAKAGSPYKYRVCSVYDPGGSDRVCTAWFAIGTAAS
jgi:hypothetical protein